LRSRVSPVCGKIIRVGRCGIEPVELVIGKDKKAYGRIKFATFQIRLNNLKKMIIEPALQKKR
jgi:hypothetical protein